jgi:hypothetical protein
MTHVNDYTTNTIICQVLKYIDNSSGSE